MFWHFFKYFHRLIKKETALTELMINFLKYELKLFCKISLKSFLTQKTMLLVIIINIKDGVR